MTERPFALHPRYGGQAPQAPAWKPGDKARRTDTGAEVEVTGEPRRHETAVWDFHHAQTLVLVQWIVSVQPVGGLADNINTDKLTPVV